MCHCTISLSKIYPRRVKIFRTTYCKRLVYSSLTDKQMELVIRSRWVKRKRRSSPDRDTLSGLLDDTLKVECPVLTSLILSEENKDLD